MLHCGCAVPSRFVSSLDAYQRRHRRIGFPIAVIYKFGDDQGPYLTALITYYGFLSLFPLLLLLTTVLGFVLQDNPDLQAQLVDSTLAELPIVGSPAARERRLAHRERRRARGRHRRHALRLPRRGRGDPERVQPRLGGAAQRAPQPDQVAPAQPAPPARARRRGARDDRALGPDHRRRRLRRRTSAPRSRMAAIPLAARHERRAVPARLPRAHRREVPTRHLWIGAAVAGIGWQVVQVARDLLRRRALRGPPRPTASSAWCSAWSRGSTCSRW